MSEKIKSWDELKRYRESITQKAAESAKKITVAVGMGTCGMAAGAGEVYEALEDELNKANRSQSVSLISVGCYGFCYAEPMVEVRIAGKPVVQYGYIDPKTARAIVREHIENDEILRDHVINQEVRLA
jgi:(2Fe-2S) ferredoxin